GRLRHDPALWRPGRLVRTLCDIRRWKRYTRASAGRVSRVVVCSQDDADRVGTANTAVVPNGIPRPAVPARGGAGALRPTVLLQGRMTYAANVDAVGHLVRDIVPRVVRALPDVEFRIVGAGSDRIRGLDMHPNVTVTGYVPDMRSELERADIVAVPLRFGSGTRLKIIEAFAHRVAVVSTAVGAEGLGATDGQELLIRNGPRSFAGACVRLL